VGVLLRFISKWFRPSKANLARLVDFSSLLTL